ncbi:MAG TPA: DUF899 domain-containing protein [Alphaproteobacteria bacterium]|jgi:predicted dithiol-disulfide oxidoreductase (DUF899 family)|nr:DUF899 domain-containing protein [Alphaproteobacteria bacterium]
MESHRIVSHDEWIDARVKFLTKEKAFTRMRDELSAARQALPWEPVDKPYVFEGPNGKETLAELFDGRSQLVVYHFMFGPTWEAGCKSCSWWADNIERNVVHLAHRDVTMVLVSRGPLEKLEAFRRRMGWTTKWVSSLNNDFNFDYGVSLAAGPDGKSDYNYGSMRASGEMPGITVFHRDASGRIFHTYSCYGRGLDPMNAGYQFLDLVPKGRDEADQTPHAMAWLRHRDSYDRT